MNFRKSILAKPLALLVFIAVGGWFTIELWTTNKTENLKKTPPSLKNPHIPVLKKELETISTSTLDIKSDDHLPLIRVNAAIKSLEVRLATVEKMLTKHNKDRLENINASQVNSKLPRPTPEELNAEIQESIDRLNDAFNVEPIDMTWSDNTETTLIELIDEQIKDGSTLSNMECRENSCRIEALHNTAFQAIEFEQILKNQTMSYYLQQIEGEQGEQISIVYFVREGITLDEFMNQSGEANQE